jgi:hypothetical protein
MMFKFLHKKKHREKVPKNAEVVSHAREISEEYDKLRDRERGRRAALKQSMPKVQLQEAHTSHGRILPTRQTLLQKIPSGGVACEIGVASGGFTADILRLNAPAKLHLIDAWSEARYAADKQRVVSAFQAEIDAGSIVIDQGLSIEMLQKFPEHYFDWVYLDTDHSYKTTAAELDLLRSRVKLGGRIAGHDLCAGNVIRPVPYGVVEACNEFCARHDWGYEYITLDSDCLFSFCLRQN